MFTTRRGNFQGISVIADKSFDAHNCLVSVGVLCNNCYLDAEVFEKELNEVEWTGDAETFCEKLLFMIYSATGAKGVLVVVEDSEPEVVAASVTGEVKQDADVKEEMYRLMRGI